MGRRNTGERLGSISWRDIVVVPRRAILKYHRVELIPTYNVSMNNPLVQHHGWGGIINFFLSETMSLGLEATYYVADDHQALGHRFLRGLDDRVLPAENIYRWSGAANFGYVPLYGKFAIFNRWIAQWEIYLQGGVGVIQTEWVNRDPDPNYSAATNYDVMWHLDLGTRFFITKWLVFHAYLKDYMFIDSFEPESRTQNDGVPSGVKQFVQNVTFGIGVGMFLPTNFEYKYTR